MHAEEVVENLCKSRVLPVFLTWLNELLKTSVVLKHLWRRPKWGETS